MGRGDGCDPLTSRTRCNFFRRVVTLCCDRLGARTVSATEAQFTPKSVETAEEREKLMFRVKLQIDPKVLAQYHQFVKTGVRGLGFVRTQTKIAWPDELAVKLPQWQ